MNGDIHFQDRWEKIVAEWEVTEQVVTKRIINGEETIETAEAVKKYVVLEMVEATCWLFYNGEGLSTSEFSTCLANSSAIEDVQLFAKRHNLTPESPLVVEAVSRTIQREYTEAGYSRRSYLQDADLPALKETPTRPAYSEWQVIWSSAAKSGETNSYLPE